MKIQDVLKPYYSTQTNALANFMEQARLNDSLQTMITTSPLPGWKLFGKMIQLRFEGTQVIFHPDHIIQLCVELGLEEFDALSAWIANLGVVNENGFLSIFSESSLYIPVTKLKTIDIAGLRLFINEKTDIDPRLADASYQIIDETELQRVVESCPSSRFIYVAEKRDCDDFVRIFRGWLSEQGYGNLAFGYCEYNAFDSSGGYLFAHAVVLAVVYGVNGEYQIKLIEPQRNNMIYALDAPQGLFSNVASIQLREIIL